MHFFILSNYTWNFCNILYELCFRLQNSMVIEYIGSIIRNEVANKRERIYESQVSFEVVDCWILSIDAELKENFQ